MCSAMDTTAVPWAAGLFDAEGSATAYSRRDRPSRQRQMIVYQAGRHYTPAVLLRFKDAIGGHGNITGPYRGRLYHWSTKKHSAFEDVTLLLWPWLGAAKRSQLRAATIGIGRELPSACDDAQPRAGCRWAGDDLAWASGFFVGEGYVGASRSSGSRMIQISIAQASTGGAPDTLLRFREAVGVGAIRGPRLLSSPWSRLPQYEWRTQSYEGVQATVALLWRWLDERKRAQAIESFRRYHDRAGPLRPAAAEVLD